MTITLANNKNYKDKNDVWLENKCRIFDKRDLIDTELTTLKFSDTRKRQMMEILQVMLKSVL